MSEFGIAAVDFLPTRRALRVERYPGGTVAAPRHDVTQLSGLHGFFGGVYGKDGFVSLSELTRSRGTRVIYDDPNWREPLIVRQAGRALYAGPLFPHYGHFLVESTARLWVCDFEDFDHVVFQLAPGAPSLLNDAQREFLSRVGILSNIVLLEEGDNAIKFDEVVVPEAAFYICDRVNPLYTSAFKKVADISSQRPERKIYMSRQKLAQGVIVGEETLEQLFSHLGFEIFYPEQYRLSDQLRVYAETDILSGVSGSALHNVLFMRSGTKVINLVRSTATLSSFFLIDNVMEAQASYINALASREVRGFASHGAQGPFMLDLPKIIRGLTACPFVDAGKLHAFTFEQVDLENRFKSEWYYILACTHRAQGRNGECRAALSDGLRHNPGNEKIAKALGAL